MRIKKRWAALLLAVTLVCTQGNMVMACIVFVITIVLCAIGMIYYKHMNEGKE